jgi:cell division septal protein FtsQ
VARRGRSGVGSRPRARADSAVVPFPRTRPVDRLELARVVPSGRSILVGLAVLALGGVAYAVAHVTSLFAVEAVVVADAPAPVAGEVRRVLESARGQSLLAVDLESLRFRVESLPTVAEVTFDRSFPHTLAAVLVPEQPAAVLRQGASSWLASARGRVMGTLERGARPRLPRVWLGRGIPIRVGSTLRGDAGAAVSAVAPLAGSRLPMAVASVRAVGGELTLELRSGLEVRLGDGADLPLKLAVAAAVAPKLPGDTTYVDVSIPKWPVAGSALNSQVEVESEGSTLP